MLENVAYSLHLLLTTTVLFRHQSVAVGMCCLSARFYSSEKVVQLNSFEHESFAVVQI